MESNFIVTRRILIVDDDTTNLNLLGKSVEKLGHYPVLATSGGEALGLLNDSIDLILLDIMMPDMNGFETLSKIRENKALLDIPVIMVTALVDRQDRLQAVEVGANDYITKPVDLIELKVRMNSLLRFKDARDEIKRYQGQMSLASRLEAVGQLAAGIAHEINTPAQYLGNSLIFLKESFADLADVLAIANEIAHAPDAVKQSLFPKMYPVLEEIDADFLAAEIPKTISRLFEGIEHISSIVQAMRRFSNTGDSEKKYLSLRESIENTLIITRSEWKCVADVATEFDPDVDLIMCYPGEINQVLLNIIINAAHTIADKVKNSKKMGLITIKTKRVGDYAEIIIQDTGTGIPENIREKVFNIFFTTKDVGKGTGQGLAISYDIIVNKHGGAISFDSKEDGGTTFYIQLPIGIDAKLNTGME